MTSTCVLAEAAGYAMILRMRFRLNRYEIFALVAVIVTTMLFLDVALGAAWVYTHVQKMSVWQQAGAICGWLIATFGPIALSVLFWRLSRHVRRAWILHLLMLPLAYLMIGQGAALILAMTGDVTGFDSTLGGPIIQAMVLFMLTIISYYSTVLIATLHARATIRR
ncbi:MAG: hypothetical protein KF730_02790 [Sphingomonas sp.]|uniref:hypothetical protein n=1 Tax=Sphingomonas sp. TaxID=28214 RepID=UPI0025EE9E16|nr:hypothetical protein [Sphingomonas sp.]MBX3563483.1 hypothetical protein [Sphingomonas sp.]